MNTTLSFLNYFESFIRLSKEDRCFFLFSKRSSLYCINMTIEIIKIYYASEKHFYKAEEDSDAKYGFNYLRRALQQWNHECSFSSGHSEAYLYGNERATQASLKIVLFCFEYLFSKIQESYQTWLWQHYFAALLYSHCRTPSRLL